MKKTVIYGGAFNPPHLGHAKVITALLKDFPADELWVMPSADRKDKLVGTDGRRRLEMIRLMVAGLEPKPALPVIVSDLEILRPRPTATFETKLELEKNYPESEFYFVVGSDALADIKEKWVNGAELYRTANFILLERPGYALPAELPSHLTIIRRERSVKDISSTMIRALIAKGESGLPYISESVAEYIRQNGLYR